tara:strand:+ start:1179 stop:1394 length:216 start_codon:yes stop_codon:yes gene_type:complete
MAEEKRYVMTVDMYVYAENDYMARKRAHRMTDYVESKYVNARPSITELGEQPFATMSYRKLDNHGPTEENV